MKLTILETSDVHGYLYPTDYQKKEQELPLGLFKAAAVIKKEKEKNEEPVVLIENGDFIQGSPLSHYVVKEKQEAEYLMAALNEMEYDAGIIGNHEFNYGMDYLKTAVHAAQHPVLAANLLNQDGEPYFGPGYTIVEKAGIKIAILGLVTQYIPHWEHPDNYKGVIFQSAVDCAKEYVARLRKEVDVVIVSYHGGFEADLETGEQTELTGENEGYRLLEEVPGIDVLLTGHQHRRIATIHNGVPIVQPGQKGEYVGKITLWLEKGEDGAVVTDKLAELLPTAEVEADKELSERFLFLHQSVEHWLDQKIGTVAGNMEITDPEEVRLTEHPYIEFVNRVQMHYAQCDISGTALFSDAVKGFKSEVTLRDVVTNYIYPNTLAVVQLTGAELKSVLERNAEYFTVNEDGKVVVSPDYLAPKMKKYNYDMYEGVEYTIDASKPHGKRIVELRHKGKEVQPEETFEVVMNQYRAIGGGEFDMLKGKDILREVTIPMTELIADYIQTRKVLPAAVNHNFKVVNGENMKVAESASVEVEIG